MQFTRTSLDTEKGRVDWLTGDVYVDAAASHAASTFAAEGAHFPRGDHTACHTHARGRTIMVAKGVGACKREGGPIAEIRPGDRVFFAPRENHWHGARRSA